MANTDTATAVPAEAETPATPSVVGVVPISTTEPVATAPAPAKRFRATKEEMERRERKALELLGQAPMTINALSTASELPYPKAQALVQKLVKAGRVTSIGNEPNGRTVYRIEHKAAAPKPVKPLPERSFADFLNQFHVGQDLKVVGVHVTEKGATLDVKTGSKNVVSVTLAN